MHEFDDRTRAAFVLATRAVATLAWAGLVFYVFVGTIPNHPMQLTASDRVRLMAFVPEGWAFFTRDPQEQVNRYYTRLDGRWRRIDGPNASASNWFGFRKTARILSIETGGISRQVRKSMWLRCTRPLDECDATRLPAWLNVVNPAIHPTVCGDLLVERQAPVPWAWAKVRTQFYIPSDVARLRVRCIGGALGKYSDTVSAEGRRTQENGDD